ncbi:bifunctional DNA primase/polymerase [Dermabacter jinjuensis]|uniref:bifunctional DNA primase/polymerase n=1 Tax=Dermabacter jinjuensis TaxID=1667168 RepID=UPI001D0542A3|nr:bifunctional DNA primase/polymerase [Dermabacter jinjuensis]
MSASTSMAGRACAALNAGRMGMPVFTVVSPSGGRHGYYPATPDVVQRSWQVARAGVDFRGDGGYIVIPPSHTTAGSYRLATVRQGAASGIDSDALRDFLDPRPALKPRAADRGMAQSGPGVVVSRLAAWVAGLGEGERNRGLFWAACRAAEHDIAPATAVDVLGAAAGEAGLGPREIAATVRSAYRTTHPTTSTAPRPTEPAAASPVRVPVGAGRGLA